MPAPYWFVLTFLAIGAFLSVKARKLTVAAALVGGSIGFALFLGTGYAGLAMLGIFFILGSAASSWKLKYKQSLGLAEENKGRRKAGQAVANAGVAALLGIWAWVFPASENPCAVMVAASFASATADTLSSELGNVYGRRYYHILTWQRDARGLNGVISLEGIIFGLIGSTLIGLLYGVGFGGSFLVPVVILAGTLGNLTDSVLGATLERRGYLNNDAVNFLNTLVAAGVAGFFYFLSDYW